MRLILHHAGRSKILPVAPDAAFGDVVSAARAKFGLDDAYDVVLDMKPSFPVIEGLNEVMDGDHLTYMRKKKSVKPESEEEESEDDKSEDDKTEDDKSEEEESEDDQSEEEESEECFVDDETDKPRKWRRVILD